MSRRKNDLCEIETSALKMRALVLLYMVLEGSYIWSSAGVIGSNGCTLK